jgi:hypothetical protein
MTRYISFIGYFEVPNNIEELNSSFPMDLRTICVGTDENGNSILENKPTGFLQNFEYNSIPSDVDEVCLFLTSITETIGHLVAECVGGNWTNETFCLLDATGNPIENFDSNPILC